MAREGLRLVALAAAALGLVGNTPPPGEVEIDVTHASNARGVLRVCLTADADHFPDCAGDPARISASVPATSRTIRLTGVQPGRYAVSLLHDENGNGRLDTTLGIPREGFGFSNNPGLRFGPPRFESVLVELGPEHARQTIRLRYLL